MSALHHATQSTTGRIDPSLHAGDHGPLHGMVADWLDTFLGSSMSIEIELTQTDIDADLRYGRD